MLIKYSNSSCDCDQLITIIIAHHLGVHVCSHLEVLRSSNTAAYTGTNPTGFLQDTSYDARCLRSSDTATAAN